MVFYNTFLSDKELHNIVNYKYETTGSTTIDRAMNPWWEFLVGFLPMDLAPNMITTIAAFGLVLPALLILFTDPSLTSDFPWYYFIFSAFGVFWHQTLDAMDGKQARRIGASGP